MQRNTEESLIAEHKQSEFAVKTPSSPRKEEAVSEKKAEEELRGVWSLDDRIYVGTTTPYCEQIIFKSWDVNTDSCEEMRFENARTESVSLEGLKLVQRSEQGLFVLNGGPEFRKERSLIRMGWDGSLSFSTEKFTRAESYQGQIYASLPVLFEFLILPIIMMLKERMFF